MLNGVPLGKPAAFQADSLAPCQSSHAVQSSNVAEMQRRSIDPVDLSSFPAPPVPSRLLLAFPDNMPVLKVH